MPMKSITRRGVLLTGSAAFTVACSGRSSEAGIPANQAGVWRGGPPLPYAAQEIYPTLHQGQIHLAGGFIADGDSISGATDRHISLDPSTGTWSDQVALPVARHHPNLISFSDRLFAIGGFEAHSSEAVWVMQPGAWMFDGESWTGGPALPQPNGESVIDLIGDHLHVCGGRKPAGEANASWNDHTDTGDHFVVSNLEGPWETAAPLPTARNSAASVMIGEAWHVVGGRTVTGGNTPAHEVYDAAEDRWRSAAPMPQGQGGLAAASVGGRLYAFGGEYFGNGGGVYPEAWVYEPSRDAWSPIPDMPHPRHGLGAVAVGADIYVIGGALQAGGSQTSKLVEIFTPG